MSAQGDGGEGTTFLQCGSGWELEPEEALVEAELRGQGMPTVRVPLSCMQRGRVGVDRSTLAVGGIPFVRAALRVAGGVLPPDECYPDALRPFMGRRVWQSTLGPELERAFSGGDAVFLKPSVRTKRFTGFVAAPGETWRAGGTPRKEPVWCSEPIALKSEWRAYVLGSRVGFLALCDGERTAEPDRETLAAMVSALAASRPERLACAIDVGVTADGSTVLVEVNDGHSLGAYDGVPGELYVALLRERWSQLSTSPIPRPGTVPD